MAVKIVTTGSEPFHGKIDLQDLNKIISDFNTDVTIQSPSTRSVTIVNTVTFTKEAIADLLSQNEECQCVNIHFGITLPEHQSCADTPEHIGNQLTVVLSLAELRDDALVDHLQENDQVILEGFRISGFAQAIPKCCGITKP